MKDHFSSHADDYAKYRPNYPAALFDFVLAQVSRKNQLWDCATGNGQTAYALSHNFKNVFATDISKAQLNNARQSQNIHYSVQPAETTGFSNDFFDCITVSQALHWFNFDLFYKEVMRTGRNGCVLATWCYSLFHTSIDVDRVINNFYTNIIDRYWDQERKFVDGEYKTIPFPFKEIMAPSFSMTYHWSVAEICGYISTWSAVKKFMISEKRDPIEELRKELASLAGQEKLEIIFPLHLRIGLIEK